MPFPPKPQRLIQQPPSDPGVSQSTNEWIGNITTVVAYLQTLINAMGFIIAQSSGVPSVYTTTSTTYVDVDKQYFVRTFTVPAGFKLFIFAVGSMFNQTNTHEVRAAITDDTTVLAEQRIVPSVANLAGAAGQFALFAKVNGDNLAHTIHLQYRATAGGDTAGMLNVGAANSPMVFFALVPSPAF